MVGNEATYLTVSLFVAGALLTMWQIDRKQQREALAEMNKKLDALQAEVTALGVKIQPFWMSLQSKLAEALTREGHGRMDGLLVKLQALTITPPERIELEAGLKDTENDPAIAPAFRATATFMLHLMPFVLGEARGDFEAGEPSKQLLKGSSDELRKR